MLLLHSPKGGGVVSQANVEKVLIQKWAEEQTAEVKKKAKQPIKKQGEYRLYEVSNHLELWLGLYSDGISFDGQFIGIVSDAENFDLAVFNAEAELKSLSDQIWAELAMEGKL